MCNIEQDIKETTWGIETFQRCVPEMYRTPIIVLIGKYYSKHPTDETVDKIVNILGDCDNKKYDTVEKKIQLVQREL